MCGPHMIHIWTIYDCLIVDDPGVDSEPKNTTHPSSHPVDFLSQVVLEVPQGDVCDMFRIGRLGLDTADGVPCHAEQERQLQRYTGPCTDCIADHALELVVAHARTETVDDLFGEGSSRAA